MAIKDDTRKDNHPTFAQVKAEQSKPSAYARFIRIRAEHVQRLEDGLFEIRLASRPMTEQEARFMRAMFPNTFEQAQALLDNEALLAAIERE